VLPVLPLKDSVPFPDTLTPLAVGQDRSVQLVNEVLGGDRMLVMVASKNPELDTPGPDDLYRVGVAGTVARMLGSSSDVEDIAQQVFIRVWKSARRYVPRAKFTTWLLKITRNLVFNEMRRTKRRPHVSLQSEPGAEDPPLKDEMNLAPDASLLESELQQAIEEAIQRLPETQRMALVLRRYQQLSYEQIAEVLDLSVPAVKSVLFRARTELRSRLSKYLD